MEFSYFLDSRFRGSDNTKSPLTRLRLRLSRPLDGQGRGELLYSAKLLPKTSNQKYPKH